MINPNDITTIRVGELPPKPPTLESKIPHELGTDLNYFTITQLIEFLQPYVGVFQYETKRLAVTQAYIDENFDETGLGRNICTGWAIRNGNNGTDNIDGKVGVAYGTSNNVIGQIGGLVSAPLALNQLPSHSHFNGIADDQTGVFVYGSTTTEMPGSATLSLQSEGNSRTNQGNTSSVGSNAPVSRMQPYIIDLYIMKL